MYSVIAAPPYHLPQPSALSFPSYGDRNLRGLRVGVMSSYNEYASAEVQASTNSVQQLLKRQGASIVDITIPHLSAAFKAHVVSILTEMRTAMQVDLRARPRRNAHVSLYCSHSSQGPLSRHYGRKTQHQRSGKAPLFLRHHQPIFRFINCIQINLALADSFTGTE